MKRLFIILFSLIFLFTTVEGQLSSILSQQQAATYTINPAAAGVTGNTSVSLFSRNQWVGVSKAPRYNVFSAETRFQRKGAGSGSQNDALFKSKQGRVGLGFSFYNDRNGHFDRTGLQITYAYHIQFRDYNQLSFGLTGAGFQMRVKDEDMTFREPNDPIVLSGITKIAYVPDANVGIMFSGISYLMGLSAGQLFQTKMKIGNESYDYFRIHRCYNFFGSYFIEVPHADILLEPNAFFRSSGTENQVEVGFNFHKESIFWVGTAFRSGTGAILKIGGFVNSFLIGYSYDLGFSSIHKYSYGTHEIFITYRYNNVFRQKMLNPY